MLPPPRMMTGVVIVIVIVIAIAIVVVVYPTISEQQTRGGP